jgi:hypothetical protein
VRHFRKTIRHDGIKSQETFLGQIGHSFAQEPMRWGMRSHSTIGVE